METKEILKYTSAQAEAMCVLLHNPLLLNPFVEILFKKTK